MKKGFVFSIHSIAGLLSGLFILLMSLSGAVLVFHDELDLLDYPQVIVRVNSKIIPVDTCYNNLQKKFPHARVSNCLITLNKEQAFVFTIYDSSYRSGQEALKVFIDPQAGTIKKTQGSQSAITSWAGRFHSSFYLGKTGEWLLGFFSLVFLLSILTGLILFRRNIGAVLAFRKRVFKKGNLHQLIGTYALLFNLMIGVTGFWMQRYVFKKEFYKSYDYTPVLKPSPPLFFSMDRALENLHRQFPDFSARVIYFPQSTKGKTTIYGSRENNSFIQSKKFADAIFLDSTGNVARTAFVNEIDASSRYDIINSQIHFGQYGGLAVKISYSLLGLTGSLLSITGFLQWYKRRKIKNEM
ncbi:MAG: PepSY-associated TM helix domain-containing protein [Bacteroidota bacterium]|nr:PepSY-associated TM helix domain-containing protein [Bacteroidota bacterium]